MKKLLLSLGSIATVVAPVTAVVACGDEKTDTLDMTEMMNKVDSGDKEAIKEAYKFFENHVGEKVILIGKNKEGKNEELKMTISKEFKKGIKDIDKMDEAVMNELGKHEPKQ